MAEKIHTGGGSAIGGNVGTGGGNFTGRDSQRTDVNISLENNDILLRLQTQLSRLADTTAFEFKMLERDIQDIQREEDKLASEVAQMRQEFVLLRLTPATTSAPPLTHYQLYFTIGATLIFSLLIAFVLFFMVRNPL